MGRMEKEEEPHAPAPRPEGYHSAPPSLTRADVASPDNFAPTGERSLLDMMNQARQKLTNMEISARRHLDHAPHHSAETYSHVELLQLQIEHLKRQLVDVVHCREDSDAIFQRAMDYASAKGTANAVLHTLFDQASAGDKNQVLQSWWETGVIITRDGLKHWRLDLREIRNENGASILHVAVDKSIARENLKLKLVELLVDRIGFDVNVRDAFGRTPLHVAAMAGYAEVTQALLAKGADASLRDRAGLTPLSVVRTLSKPPPEIVQLLAAAESELARRFKAASASVSSHQALCSAFFLRTLGRFIRADRARAFSRQAGALLDALLHDKSSDCVAFDDELARHVPLLFEGERHNATSRQLARVDSLFRRGMFHDRGFVDELKVEVSAYGHSLVTSTCTTAAALAGATWEGLLLKMIQTFKLEIASATEASATEASASMLAPDQASVTNVSSVMSEPSSPASASGRSVVYADRSLAVASTRQAWHYAVLFKSSTHPFPCFLTVEKGNATAACSEDVSRFFPLEDRLLIGSSEYHCVSYDAATRVIQLDRAYEGADATQVKAYLAGSCSSLLPPYIATKRILEREPGNRYEEHMSSEQELFQDYQFLDPDSEYEVAVKLGPVPSPKEARAIVDAWKAQTRKLFEEKTCLSGFASCAHYCPQRSGHSLCVETMAVVGRDLAKDRLGRPTFSKQLKPRASLQKYQDLFLGQGPWPGSPATAATSEADITDQLAAQFKASLALDDS